MSERDEHIGARRRIHRAVPDVRYDSDDLGPVAESPLPHRDRLPDRVFTRPEPPGRGLVDEHHLRRPRSIRRGEIAPVQQRNPHCFQIVRRYPVDPDRRFRAAGDFGTVPEPNDGAIAAARQRRAVAHPGRLHAGQAGHASLQLLEESKGSLRSVLQTGQVDPHGQEPCGIDPGSGRHEAAQTLDHEPRRYQQDQSQRHFRDYQKTAALQSTDRCPLRPCVFEGVRHTHPARLERRNQPEQRARQEPYRESEKQRA